MKTPFLPNAKKYSIKTSEIAEPVLESLAMTSSVIGRSLRDLKELLFSLRSGRVISVKNKTKEKYL